MKQDEKKSEILDKKKVSSQLSLSGWLDQRAPFLSFLKKEYIEFPMPKNLNIWWAFGAALCIILLLMCITGIFLSLTYVPTAQEAFLSIETIERRVPSGWMIRAIHIAGSNLFLFFMYLHLFRGLYYGSYKSPRELVWLSGLIIMMMIMITAFAGYVLPWGQMSYWAANVVMQALSSIPWVGKSLSYWLMGGTIPNTITLHRLFVLHFVVAFAILVIVGLHIIFFHVVKSNNPEGVEPCKEEEVLPFYPYFVCKDGVVIVFAIFLLVVLAFFFPNLLTNSENYISANPLETPTTIAPEWYFLPFYGILQVVPSKFGGVLLAMGSVCVLFLVPWLDRSPIKSCKYRPLHRVSLFLLIMSYITLGVVGKIHDQPLLIWLGRFALFYYYFHFLIVMPFSLRFDLQRSLPKSLLDAVRSKP
ncbi:Cytochrome b/c1 [Commensalibacter sp. Nvir]|uniref:cytochrome b n=1 Tax=Commensalibacter sp. Nvir TaxID=3069817 RepID=UPI002D3F1994|nr:Cytochrome b/c1 [Commensalibacter sp. Nvir]